MYDIVISILYFIFIPIYKCRPVKIFILSPVVDYNMFPDYRQR